jgi:hypothetical protein
MQSETVGVKAVVGVHKYLISELLRYFRHARDLMNAIEV